MKCAACKERMALYGDKCWECRDEALRKVTFAPAIHRGYPAIHGKVGQFQTSLHNPHAGSTRGG